MKIEVWMPRENCSQSIYTLVKLFIKIKNIDLPNGALYYSLVVDGSVKDTKIMILNR